LRISPIKPFSALFATTIRGGILTSSLSKVSSSIQVLTPSDSIETDFTFHSI